MVEEEEWEMFRRQTKRFSRKGAKAAKFEEFGTFPARVYPECGRRSPTVDLWSLSENSGHYAPGGFSDRLLMENMRFWGRKTKLRAVTIP